MHTKTSSPIALISIFLLLVTFVVSYCSLQEPEVNDKITAENQFSATKALQRLTDILPPDNKPHPVNSVANAEVRNQIIRQLEDLGLSTEVQDTMGCTDGWRALNCSRVRNIITKIPGTDSSQTVLLMAHYDSVPAAAGAADAGHAVAIILEILEMMKQQPTFKNDLIVLINEGEEFGLLGAEAFVKEHPLAATVDVVINMEARGNKGKSLLFETGENNYRLLKLYQQYAKNPTSNSLTYEIYKLLPNDTDLTVLKRFGKTGVNFAFQGRVSHYHTPLDNIQNLSPGSVQHQGDNAYAMLQALLSTDLQTLPEGNAVYTDILSSFMVIWPDYMTIPLTFFSLFLLILICWQLVRIKQLTVTQLSISLPFAFAITLLSSLSCWILLNIVQFLSGQSQPWLSEAIPMRAAVWLLPVALSMLFANKYKEKLGFWGLVIAAVSFLVAISVTASLYMTGISYLTLIPSLVVLILLSLIIITNQIENTKLITASLMLSSISIAILVFPIMLLLEDAMGLVLAPVFGLLESLVILLTIPLIVYASQSVLKQIIYACGIISLLGLVISSQQQAFSPIQPQAMNFEYLQQGETASIQALTRHSLPQKMIAESAFSNEQKITRPWSKAIYPSITTESLALPEPELQIISSEKQGDINFMTLRFISKRASSQFLLYSSDNKRLTEISFDKNTFAVPSKRDIQYFLCTGIDCNGMSFTIKFTGDEPLKIGLVDYEFGLPTSLGYLTQSRGDSAQQIQTGDVTLVQKDFELVISSNIQVKDSN